jgi:hypothetical protein
VEGERTIGYDEHCEEVEGGTEAVDGLLQSRVVTDREVRLRYGEADGWDVEVREEVRVGSTLADGTGLFALSTASLVFLGAAEHTTQHDETVLTSDDKEEDEMDKQDVEELLEKGKRLLVKLTKATPTAVEGTRAFLALVALLEPLSRPEGEALIRHFRTKKAFRHVVEAAAGSGNPALQELVLEALVADRKAELLERFLVLASLGGAGPGLAASLGAAAGLGAGPAETALYAACRLQPGGAAVERARGGDARLLANCLAAGGGPGGAGELLDRLAGGGQDRERVLAALGRPGVVASEERPLVEARLLEAALGPGAREERAAALTSLAALSLSPRTMAALLPLAAAADPELAALASQVLVAALRADPGLPGRPELLSWAPPPAPRPAAQSLHLQQELGRAAGRAAGFTFQAVAGPAGLRRSLLLLEAGGLELLRFATRLDGLSGLLGEQEEADGGEAEAAVEVSLLGLPLRPLHLFSSLGELMELYWAGAGQDRSSLVQGSALLLRSRRSLTLASGLSLDISLMAAGSVAAAGQLAPYPSRGSQSGGARLEREVAAVARLEATVGGGLLLLAAEVAGRAEGGLETVVKLGGGAPLACLQPALGAAEVEGVVREERPGEQPRERRTHRSLPGLTWNLGGRNNLMCNTIGT